MTYWLIFCIFLILIGSRLEIEEEVKKLKLRVGELEGLKTREEGE